MSGDVGMSDWYARHDAALQSTVEGGFPLAQTASIVVGEGSAPMLSLKRSVSNHVGF